MFLKEGKYHYRAEMAKGEGPAPFARLYANSFDPERSGDLAVQTAPTCVLAPYPAGTSHRALDAEARRRVGIGEGLVRLSVGIEDPADIMADLDQALRRAG